MPSSLAEVFQACCHKFATQPTAAAVAARNAKKSKRATLSAKIAKNAEECGGTYTVFLLQTSKISKLKILQDL